MTTPSNYILSSDYLSIGNDGAGSISVTIPASINIAAGSYATYIETATIGTNAGSNFRCLGKSSKSSRYCYGTAFYTMNKGVAGAPINGDIAYYTRINVYRTSATQLTLRATVINNLYPSATLTTSSTAETITIYLLTMVVQ